MIVNVTGDLLNEAGKGVWVNQLRQADDCAG